jgi:hypothetical protein
VFSTYERCALRPPISRRIGGGTRSNGHAAETVAEVLSSRRQPNGRGREAQRASTAVRRNSVAIAVAIALLVSARPSGDAPAVERTRQYLKHWQQALSAVVAEERYTQTLREWPYGRNFVTARNRSTLRELVSDVLLIHVPRDDAWLLFRDVLSVDGKIVQDREQRFDDLFRRSDVDVLASARAIADEGARYNLGQLARNLNTPTSALIFLEPAYRESVRWKEQERVRLDGVPVTTLAFEQRRAPFAIRSIDGRPQPASGRFWVVPDTGRIVRSVLELRTSSRTGARSSTRIEAHFGPVAGIDEWAPLVMEERYEAEFRTQAEDLTGRAIYTKHRVFRTGARVIVP